MIGSWIMQGVAASHTGAAAVTIHPLVWTSLRHTAASTSHSVPMLVAGPLREPRRLISGGGSSSSDTTSSSAQRAVPTVPRGGESANYVYSTAKELPPIIDMPAPPRPAFYVPPAQRDPHDESLAFLKPGSPLQHLRRPDPGAGLPDGVERAPELPAVVPPKRVFRDADAARVGSTSVHAGQPLLHRRSVVDTSSYYYSAPGDAESASAGGGGLGWGEEQPRSRLHTLQDAPERQGEDGAMLPDSVPNAKRATTPRERSLFAAAHEFAAVDKTPEQEAEEQQRAAPKPAMKQLEADIKKLEYYYGTPQYEKLLADFRAKYGAERERSSEDEAADSRTYTAAEVARGLDTQPLDYLRGSPKLRAQLLSGPRAYDPVTIMQQHGVMRFQGYAFPPTAELGKLKGDGDQLKALHDAHRSHPLVATVRRRFNALIGRSDARDDYVAMADRDKTDTHLLYRTLGLDAVQRRQMRYMLTDFDHADRHTSFHVMMSYPYTDWLHVFYMVFVGWCLYQLQVRYGAYEFYDEYMGLDLRQVPRLQKPVLAGITVVVMMFLLFQPLLVASIATNRAYRIVMRRPIGPP